LHKRFQIRPTKNLKTDDTCILSHTTQLQEAVTFTTAFHLCPVTWMDGSVY